MKDYYAILQVSPRAEQEVIEGAFRRLAKKYHPDVYSGPDAASRMRELNEAYEVLGDTRRRAEYDAALRFARARAETKRPQGDRTPPPPPPPPPPHHEPKDSEGSAGTKAETPTPRRGLSGVPPFVVLAAVTVAVAAVVVPLIVLGAARLSEENGETDPPIGDVVNYAPSTAASTNVREIRSNGVPFAELSYTITSQVSYGSGTSTMEWDREYLELYHWKGAWDRVFNLYDIAARLYTPDESGPLEEGQPLEETALITGSLTPVSGVADVGDILVLETNLWQGPRGLQHPSPTITVLRCEASDCTVLWTGKFAVRGNLVSARPRESGVEITVQAYLSDDPMCCPRGWEMVYLIPELTGLFSEATRCVGPEYQDCLTSMR